jgi:hypothetical protein
LVTQEVPFRLNLLAPSMPETGKKKRAIKPASYRTYLAIDQCCRL